MKKTNAYSNDFRDAYPIMRIDYKQKLMDANLTSLPLLAEWNCKKGSKISNKLMNSCPEIKNALTENISTTCKMSFGDMQIWFDIIPFPEAGYIGLYGYHIEAMVPDSKTPKKLRMAA